MAVKYRKKKGSMKSILFILASFFAGVIASPMVLPILSKLPVVGGLVAGLVNKFDNDADDAAK